VSESVGGGVRFLQRLVLPVGHEFDMVVDETIPTTRIWIVAALVDEAAKDRLNMLFSCHPAGYYACELEELSIAQIRRSYMLHVVLQCVLG
jgi:hypothetical protein